VSSHSTKEAARNSIAVVGTGNLREAKDPSVPQSLTLSCSSLNFSKIVPNMVDEGVRGDGFRKDRSCTRERELRHSTHFCSTQKHPGPSVP
jgi:hypothetical protein